ncbi:MAG: hypothetical protein JWO30_4558 [Fibrobacteres bacterium]|nr:hypothetical protein [Fibrobacterota bacterium]
MKHFLSPEYSALGHSRQPDSHGQSGAAALPIIITIAVAITLLQVPLLYKTNSGNKFSGAQKSNITAKSLAEAGIDEIISDIGRKAISVGATTDTTPYANIGLGRGTYTTHVKSYQANPYRVEVTSTGRIGSNAQSIRAKMELVKTLTTIPYDTPRLSLWGIRGTPPTLYYHSLEERDSGWAWIHPEGEVQIPGGGTLNIDDFTVAPNGTMYFINNVGASNSALYKIRPTDLDNNPSTPVTARLVGPTGLVAGSVDEIRGLTFIAHDTTGRNGVLYAVTWKSKKIYELSLENGAASFVSNIIPKNVNPGDDFWCDAMTQDLVGTIYIVRNNAKSELWRFDEFVEGPGAREDSVSSVAEISGNHNKTRALAGHPNGYLYATDDLHWYKISPNTNPANRRTTTLFSDSSDLHGIGFHYEREDLKFTGRPISHKINICHYPPGNCANMHTIQIDSSALNAHMHHGGAGACATDTPGYCGGGLSVFSITDTTIQLKVISWEEVPGEMAVAH